ncbi:alpha/beta hydrolase [Nitrogeniibacter mangrovi]|uniref:Alpha/beta hydrolase n=1 Tax=Nitrogeniibacter mangrovi TaxID=2016596 RepID=A0A6C1B0W2_9RHOO|nr:hypothetical protein [Nitrogeniibacter mangrovi]QID16468.1 alpha/beta hydrolase [Nitrogeniibacter mangrovi]
MSLPADTRVVLLPGAYDTPADFLTHGFDAAARAAGVDLHTHPTDLNAVASGALVHTLHEAVIAPARRAGVRRLLLGGISIGALTALTYADTYPDGVDGLVLLAPYPGNRMITGAITAAGGLRHWDAGGLAPDEGELRGWRALQTLARRQPPPVWLGYGRQDRFAPGHALMAEVLPPDRVATVDGGHDWPTWRQLWDRLLATGLRP